ncbi:MAG: 3-deoxy-7-phosphoheptulonate synthase [Phycisphaeraceae bacterium]|nr:3-deoxy-7-phosphoheptulonate synthase [Phycisphaeraceae bacterium]
MSEFNPQGWSPAHHPAAEGAAGWATLRPTQNVNVDEAVSLVTPRQLREMLPHTAQTNELVADSRETIQQILSGSDQRMLLIVGPCSIHDRIAALDYAQRLAELRREVIERVYIVMRVYFEKPRTTIGWKGLINDPHLNGSFDISEGLRLARQLMLDILNTGLPVGTEILDPIVPQYIADLVTWAAIGARTTESQTHRQMASGVSMPVGFKNSTEGNLQVALDAMKAARGRHAFLGMDDEGRITVIKTRGNSWGHPILRGGGGRMNFNPEDVASAQARMRAGGLEPNLMVDCSHANAAKKAQNQQIAFRSVVEQRRGGNRHLFGMMVESNLHEGNQELCEDVGQLKYGVSITDSCIGWEETEALVRWAYDQLGPAH